MNESSIQGFSEDFEQYEYSVVEDGHACPICTALNGKVFNIKDRVPGVNFPPMHPWCRCSFKVHVDDWNEWLKAQSNKTRAEKVLNNLSDDDIIKQDDIQIGKSVGAKALNYKIIDKTTGETFNFVEGTRIEKVSVFAGKGSKTPLNYATAIGLEETYPGSKAENWQHVKGIGTIDYYGEPTKAEVHWFQEETVGKHKFRIKWWLE